MSELLKDRGRLTRSERRRRRAPAALAVLAAGALLTGCSAFSGGSDDATRLFPDFLKGLKQQAPITAPRSEAFKRGIFERVNDERRAEQAAVSAFCTVATEVASSGQSRTEGAWVDEMRAQVREDNSDAVARLAQGKLGEIQAATPLDEIKPPLARRYAQSFGVD